MSSELLSATNEASEFERRVENIVYDFTTLGHYSRRPFGEPDRRPNIHYLWGVLLDLHKAVQFEIPSGTEVTLTVAEEVSTYITQTNAYDFERKDWYKKYPAGSKFQMRGTKPIEFTDSTSRKPLRTIYRNELMLEFSEPNDGHRVLLSFDDVAEQLSLGATLEVVELPTIED